MQIFDVIIFFKLRAIQQKTVKPTYLCPLGARKLAEGKGHETASDVIIFFKLRTIQQKTVKPTYLCPLGARKLAEGKGHETA